MTTAALYLDLLRHSFEVSRGLQECGAATPLAYLSESIFGFTTYDSEIDELFAAKAVEVCAAINGHKTFDYIKDQDNYRWFLLMCNMPFFAERLEWGTSIRGAWWGARPGAQLEFSPAFGLWNGEKQITDTMTFTDEQWNAFIAAIIAFAGS